MPSVYTNVAFTNAPQGGITAAKLNLLCDDLSAAIAAAGGGGGTGTGDMLKSVYDTNDNGKVDTCDSVPWASVSGKPSTFPPDSTAMLKSVYDTNGNSIVDAAESVPWSGVSGKPATFPPDPHQASHVTGTDQIPSADTTKRGLMPQANTNPNAFYASDATQKQVTYAMLGGSQPGPVSHAASHVTGGGDIIPVATTSAVGLAPVRSGTATTYLNGAGAYTTPSGTVPSVHGSTHVGGAADPIPIATTTVAGLAPAKPNAGVNATTTQVVMGDDTRLSDARTPNSTLAHQASHVTGADQIPSASTSVRGLMPVANNVANNFYASDATQKQVTYAMLGGSQPAPTVHAPSHKSGGADAIKLDEFAAPTDIVALNVSTSAHGLAPKLSGNAATYLDGTGAYSAVSGSANPGTWTTLTPASGWTVPTQAQYRVEVNGAVSTVHFRGMIQAAYSAMGTTVFTVPAGGRPSMTRSCVLGGAQNTGTASDISAYLISVSSAGVATIYFIGAAAFVWADPSKTQQVYLDGLSYSL